MPKNTEYTLTQESLKYLLSKKLVNKIIYIYLALLIDFGEFRAKFSEVEIMVFCDKWNVKKTDFYQALVNLDKHKACKLNFDQLTLDLF